MRRPSEPVTRLPRASGEAAHGGIGPKEGSYNTVGNIFYGPKLAPEATLGNSTIFCPRV
jgi:hypothetical protein